MRRQFIKATIDGQSFDLGEIIEQVAGLGKTLQESRDPVQYLAVPDPRMIACYGRLAFTAYSFVGRLNCLFDRNTIEQFQVGLEALTEHRVGLMPINVMPT